MQKRISIPTTHGPGVNVSPGERLLSTFAAGALMAYGLKRRDTAGMVLGLAGGALLYRGATGHCEGYRAANVNTAEPDYKGLRAEHAITINDSPERLYQFWRNFENLPQIMKNVESVRVLNDKLSLWRAKAPAGAAVEWQAEIVRDIPNELIEWRSAPESTVRNSGTITFRPAPAGRGTEVHVVVEYQPPAGKLGDAVAKLFGRSPQQEIGEDLRRFKQVMETGEIATTEGQPSAHQRSMLGWVSGSKKGGEAATGKGGEAATGSLSSERSAL